MIQKTVDTAAPGDTITVRAGTFIEQVSITKILTITGAGAGTGGTTIKAPAAPVANIPALPAEFGYAIVALSGGANVTMPGFIVDGPFNPGHACSDDFIGVTVYGNSTLTMSNSAITNITNSDTSLLGYQQGVGIQIGRNSLSQVGTATLDNAGNPGGTGQAGLGNVTFSPWSGNIGCTVQYGVAAKLVFTTQPGGAVANAALNPQPVVTAQDASGNLGINFTGGVTLALGANPGGGGTLNGTRTVNAVAGVATFSGLSVDKPGVGYTLTASATGLTGATSAAFTITPPVPTISAVSPAKGSTLGGDAVTITGTNFIAGDVVTFGGAAATNIVVVNSTTITAIAPAHAAGTVDVRVVNANNQGNTLAGSYQYTTPDAAPGTTGRPVNIPPAEQPPPAPAPPGRTGLPNPSPGR